MNCYKVGDLMLYNNRNHLTYSNTLVLIMGIASEKHRKIMFLKDGFIGKACWIGHLLPIGDSHVNR